MKMQSQTRILMTLDDRQTHSDTFLMKKNLMHLSLAFERTLEIINSGVLNETGKAQIFQSKHLTIEKF